MVAKTLTMLRRSDLPNRSESVINMPKIAWKTGTSYGRRDAWSIGFNNNYTVGIWCGNFDGKGVPELNGADIATPLLLQIFNAIGKKKYRKRLVQKAKRIAVSLGLCRKR
jgi:penicillin-binding protein 1C